MSKERIKMVLVGAGFMGREHLQCVQDSPHVHYVAVVDKNPQAGKPLAEDHHLLYFEELNQALEALSPDAVDICTPTIYHLPLIRICADHKIPVLCEKPIAHTAEDAQAIEQIAQESGIGIMVAQVIRFWPEYAFVRNLTKTKQYGDLLAIDCKRMGPPPAWNSWMLNPALSGGAVIDMQVHDMDFVCQLLGRPSAIDTRGRICQGGVNHVYSRLIYPQNLPVYLETSMIMPQSFPFRMYFKIDFEQAAVEMDFWRPKGQRLKVFSQDAQAYSPDLELHNAYQAEIEYFAGQVLKQQSFDESPLDEALDAVRLCLLSEKSYREGKPVDVQ
jgi:predicted dehydrogenase